MVLDTMDFDFSNIPLAPLATVVAALITALMAFVNLTLSKEQKTSEFRQAWIDGLRDELAIFFSSARALCRVMEESQNGLSSNVGMEIFSFDKNCISKMRLDSANALYKIQLRLNPTEEQHIKLIQLLRDSIAIQNQINREGGKDYTKALDAIDIAVESSQQILKLEWKRVKSGEVIFRVSRGLFFPVIIAVTLFFIYALMFNDSTESNTFEPRFKESSKLEKESSLLETSASDAVHALSE
ncbi:hypothetical protein [Photobacterium leiognathi]|uniref:hypothetical protein n=1 Tax=Photobacterium leiognathi TaxID=553611 RepID=UPI00298195A3|nr:hypothetical protein [Photobacterium leiognathi]